MKTILWAAIMANGNYMHGDADYRWSKLVFADFDATALAVGNCIIGRKTYEEYAGAGGDFGGLEIVVVSRTPNGIAGVTCVTSPAEALRYLESKGHTSALVGGGDSLINAFLADGFGDEIVLNVTPELGGPGNRIALAGDGHRAMVLVSVKELGEGIVRLQYSLKG